MKRFLTLLWLSISAFSFKATAQPGTTCNAEFAVQYISNNTVKFNPVIANDSPLVRHFWSFGDGSTGSQLISPTHTYVLPGTYTVVHTLLRVTHNNIPVCTQTFTKQVTITAACNLIANFSWTVTAANPLTVAFHNLSTPLSNTDSIRWTFGDGTSSTAVNPVHTYNAPGTYTVCLRVKKHTAPGAPVCVREICKTVVVPPTCNMVINFSWAATPTNPLRIEFHALINPIAANDSIRWTFGDGSSSNQLNPVHTYNVPGTYTVCLRVIRYNSSNIPCVREICKTIVIPVPCNLVANFTSQPDPNHPLRIKFTNTSSPIHATDSVRWTFGDGTSVSGLQSDPNIAAPTHNYANAGTYTVCIRVKKNNISTPHGCVREKCETIVIPPPCNLVVNFTSQSDPNHPLRIKFTNTSVPIAPTDSLKWTFGDGTSLTGVQSNPNVASPVHIYATAGTYNVCLIVKKHPTTVNAPCIKDKCRSIIVHAPPPCNLVVNFTAQPDPNHPLRIKFTNTSVPTSPSDSVRWTFGDGTSVSGLQSNPNIAAPTHNYTSAGNYKVCLRVKKNNTTAPGCVREICDTIYVHHPVPPCTQLSKFHFERFPNDVQKYKFTADYLNPALHYTWTFGDGNGSHDPIAIHRYAQPGIYVACLTVWRGPNCASTTCREIRVEPQVRCDTAHAWFTYQRNPQISNKIQFTANATIPIIDQTWTFTKVPNGQTITLHQNNPLYTFQDTGLYKVCLKAVLLGGCVKEYCSYIRIEHVSNVCELQVYPNPTSEWINVNVHLTQPEMIHAYVYNSQQVLVMDKHQQGHTGNNLVKMNVHHLPAGQYTIKFIYGNKICYARFQKL